MKNISMSLLQEQGIPEIVLAFQKIGWNKPEALYRGYLEDQKNWKRVVLVARLNNQFTGYGTLKLHSDYPPFSEIGLPEISDLNVLPDFRGQGIGSQLISELEQIAASRNFTEIGIGVGMTSDYGAAQRLYVRLNYVPDGKGLFYKDRSVQYGTSVPVDDDLALWFRKKLGTVKV